MRIGGVACERVHVAEFLLLALWTGWLIIALALLGKPRGVALLALFAVAGLPLTLTGAVAWRPYLVIWLIIHALAAAVVTLVQRTPQQVPAGSVSLSGVIWLSILHPASAAVYFTVILLMIIVSAALVVFEYNCWRAFTNVIWRRVDAAVAEAEHDADRRVQAANQESIRVERLLAVERERHKETKAECEEQLRVITARQHPLQTQLSQARRNLRHVQDSKPLVMHPIAISGLQREASAEETDQVSYCGNEAIASAHYQNSREYDAQHKAERSLDTSPVHTHGRHAPDCYPVTRTRRDGWTTYNKGRDLPSEGTLCHCLLISG